MVSLFRFYGEIESQKMIETHMLIMKGILFFLDQYIFIRVKKT